MISCSESEFNTSRLPSLNRRHLFVPTTSMSFDAQPSTQKIDVESDQTDWVLNIPVDWVKSNQMNGDSSASLEISTLLNNSADTSRVCVATISSNVTDWNRSFPITITQKKNNPYITINDNSIILSAIKQSASIIVSTNTEYTIDNTGSSWLHIDSFSSSEVRYSVDENNTDKERNAILTLKAKSYSGTSTSITVRQKISNLTTTKEKLYFGHSSSSQQVVIESEASWTTTSTSWVSASPNSGEAGKTAVNISVPNNASINSRTGSVYFKIAENNNIEIPIEQEGITLSADQSAIHFDSYGGEKILTIQSNDSWQIFSKSEWVNISTTSGNGNETIKISTSENNTTIPKSGEFVITSKDNVTSITILVDQEAKNVDFSDATLSYGYNSSSQKFSFETNGNWSLTKDSDWFSVDKTTGSGDATITITVDENNTLSPRQGILSLVIADKSFIVQIYQSFKYLNISSSEFTFTANPGNTKLSIESNTQWSAKIIDGVDWIMLTPQNGSENAEITINVTENKTITPRFGKIELDIPNVQTYIIDIIQNRRYIKTDMSSIDFLPTGGQISFNVTTDGTYEVSKIGSWFGYVKSGDCITVIAQENTNSESRTGAIILKMTNLEGGGYSIMIPVTQTSN